MPFKSKAQRRKFAQLLVEGKIDPDTYEEWNRETGGTRLPERVGSKKKRAVRKKRGARRTTAARKKRVSPKKRVARKKRAARKKS